VSKAFTREGDGEEEDKELPDTGPAIPPGTRNYMTPAGAERLKVELRRLLDVDRPEVVRVVTWAASNGDRSENADYIYGKRRLREIDRRIRFLTKRLEIAEIVDPSKQSSDRVQFGATVEVQDEKGGRRTYRIVGVDETDARRGHISWISPMGRALLRAKVGDTVTLRRPGGEEDLEIVALRYEAIE